MKNGSDKQPKARETSFIVYGSMIYDLVGDKNHLSFVEYDTIAETAKLVESVQIDDDLYLPPQNDLIRSGTISLAEYPQEYGSIIELFESTKHFIYKYVDVPETFLVITTLYVLLTWIYDCFDVIPYLRVIGEFGTGKSRYLMVVGSVCYKACFAGGATSLSPIFRINEIYKGVSLVFDEADFKYSGADSDMVKILNCGYMRGMPVLRTEGDGNNRAPKGFDVYGPKIIATRSQYQDLALESRCLTQVMAGRPRKDIPRHLPKTFKAEAMELKNKLQMFRLRNYGTIELDPSLEIEELEPRINQVALPILSIIKDEVVRDQVCEALKSMQTSLNGLKQDQEPALILRSLVELIKENEETLGFKEVAKKINQISGVDSDYSYAVSPAKIGRVNKATLGLETHQVNGVSRFKASVPNIQLIATLCQRYAVEGVDDVDLVDQYFGTLKNQPEGEFVKQVKETLF